MEHCLRLAQPADQEFLFKLYASTRPEVSTFGWPVQQQEAFLRMQFTAQQRWYQTAYPAAQHNIIVAGDLSIGRMLVAASKDSFTLVDISLLPEYRGHGIGTELIRNLLEQTRAQGQTLKLQVLRTNRAQKLYQRLGFVVTGQDELYLHMQAQAVAGPNRD